jgi:biopolymer transport protein TolR
MPKLEPIPSSSSRAGGRRARAARVSSSLAEINVVPLVDVMLVLLVIFMVAAPMMQQGFPVNLPQARRAQATAAPITVTIPPAFHRDHRVQIDDEYVPLGNLALRIREALDTKTRKDVLLASDTSVTVQDLVSVMDELKAGGVTNVPLQTQPATGR